jgi:hypothetical protein
MFNELEELPSSRDFWAIAYDVRKERNKFLDEVFEGCKGEINVILAEIKKTADRGYFNVRLDKRPSRDVKTVLFSLGFSFREHDNSICWE